MNIYVGNLSFDVTEDQLKELFGPFGQVTEVRLIMDKFTGKSKGFGFIEMPSKEDAEKAIEELNGKDIDGREIAVNEARPRVDRGDRKGPGGYGGGRGDRKGRGGYGREGRRGGRDRGGRGRY